MDTYNLLNHLVTAVMVIDAGLRPCFANAAAEQLLGTGSHRLTEQTLSDIFQLQEVPASVLTDAVAGGQGLTVNTATLIGFDGQQHTVDLTLIPLENQPGLSLLELRQVDQQRRIHQQLSQDAQQQAAQFLVRNLAHEIKNPLGGLRGAAQLLARELDDPSLKEFTNLIIEQADRMRTLVDKLLGPQKPTAHLPHNIHEVAQKVLKLVELSTPGHIRIRRDYDPSIPDIDMDADQLQQALLNIVQNAVQALEKQGGTITVRTRTDHQVTIGSQRHKLVLTLSVIDDGPGIPPELMDTLFYPMVTGREQGSGLGLSIAHNIARLHGGRIDCDSAPGHTQFVLTLPIKAGKQANKETS